MKKISISIITVVCLLFSTFNTFGAVAGEDITSNEDFGNFAELEYTVLANAVTVRGQAATAEKTQITVWIIEAETEKDLVIRQFESNDDGSFERRFKLNPSFYDADNTATIWVGAKDTNTREITGIELFSQAEIDGCVSDFGSITDKESIGAFFETYADILNLKDEDGNPYQYSEEELATIFEIYTSGNYEVTDTQGVLDAIGDIVDKYTRLGAFLEELNAAADGGDGQEVKRLLTSKYASLITFEISTAKLIKPDEMWLRMTETSLTDSRGDVLGSEKNYLTIADIKEAYEAAYAAQYECDGETGGVTMSERTYNFVETDEKGDSVWKLSYSANIITISGRHELAQKTNLVFYMTDATTDSITIALQVVKTETDGSFTVTMPLNTERFGDETLAIIRVGALDTNIWQFFVPIFPQSVIDVMIEGFKDIESFDDFKSFLTDNYEILRVGAGFSDHKLKVMYSLYEERDYSELEDAFDVAMAIEELGTGTTDILNFIDEINDASKKESWGTIRQLIETKYSYLAETVNAYKELLDAAKDADVKSFKGLYHRMTKKTYSTIGDVKEAFDEAYEEQYAYENQPKKETGGGSSGGGGGGMSFGGGVQNIVPDIPVETTPSGSVIPEGIDPEKLPVAPFTDVDNSYSWAKTAIDGLRTKAILSGDGNGKFRPGDNMTREEYLTLLLKTYGIEAQRGYVSFDDVDSSAWYADVVSTAYEMGITNGIGGNKFGIGQKITRTDAVVLAARTAEKLGISFPQKEKAEIFEDYVEIPQYGYDYVVMFQQADLINGDNIGRFNPLNNLTRAEAAVIFWNIYGFTK